MKKKSICHDNPAKEVYYHLSFRIAKPALRCQGPSSHPRRFEALLVCIAFSHVRALEQDSVQHLVNYVEQ